MKKTLKTINFSLFLLCVTSCNVANLSNGHFSQNFSEYAEPQTDDERTLIGEYHDYLSLVDSIADIWNGTDTVSLRRLIFEEREQRKQIDHVSRYNNIRRSMKEDIERKVDAIYDEIAQKFPKDLREEWIDWYFDVYHCSSLWKSHPNRAMRNERIYQTTYGEYYVIRQTRSGYPKKVPIYVDAGEYESNQQRFSQHSSKESYEVGDGNPMQEIELPKEAFAANAIKDTHANETDWDATEIDWCEECEAKDYSCCPKCKTGERANCECKCKACGAYYNN